MVAVTVKGSKSEIGYWLHWDQKGEFLGLQPVMGMGGAGVVIFGTPEGEMTIIGYDLQSGVVTRFTLSRNGEGKIIGLERAQ